MYKKRKSILENLLTKKGNKYKTEIILKAVIKSLQKATRNKSSTPFIKNAIVKSADSQVTSKQVLKRGKRKRTVNSKIVLVSEKARYANAWKNVIKKASTLKGSSLSARLAETVSQSKQELFNNAKSLSDPIDKTISTRFRW